MDSDKGFNLTPGGDTCKPSLLNISSEELQYLYCECRWTQQQCADHFNCSVSTIYSRLKELDLTNSRKCSIDVSKLATMYIDLRQSRSKCEVYTECADYFNCSVSVIQKQLKANGIRVPGDELHRARQKHISKEELEEYYTQLRLSYSHLEALELSAKHFNCSSYTMLSFLREYNIYQSKKRKRSVSIKIDKDDLCKYYLEYRATLSHTQAVDQCAKHFSCSRTVIFKRLVQYQIGSPNSDIHRKLELPWVDVYAMYQEGRATGLSHTQSLYQCADHFNCSRTTIRRGLFDSGKYQK